MPQIASVKTSATRPCWVLHDDAAGNRRQATALAEALALPFDEWTLAPRRPWSWFAPRLSPGCGAAFGPAFFETLRDAPPALAIGCGRQASLATRLAGRAGAKVVQILDPRIPPRHWNLVIAPEHDRLRGENAIPMLGSLNPVDTDWLARARDRFPAFGRLPSPRTAVLLGGPTRAVNFNERAFATLSKKTDRWLAGDHGSLMLCGSPRTPTMLADAARRSYTEGSGVLWLNAQDGVNPYAGILAWADRIIATPDSVNMISEACATSVPVFIATPELATGRLRNFIERLLVLGRVRRQEDEPTIFPVVPLRETARVAALVRERLSLPGAWSGHL